MTFEEKMGEAKKIIDGLPDYKMDFILGFIKGFSADIETNKDKFCNRPYWAFLYDYTPDKDEVIKDLAKELGINI